MAYRWAVGDLRTGGVVRTVDLIDGQWTTYFDAIDTLSGAYPGPAIKQSSASVGWGLGNWGAGPWGEGDSSKVRPAWPSITSDTATAKSFLAVAWVAEDGTETWIAGGPLWTRQDDDPGWRFGAAGLASYWDHRKLVRDVANVAKGAPFTYTAAELGLIVKRLMQQAQSITPLPLVFEQSDAALGGAGTKHTRTYDGFNLTTIGSRIDDLTKVEDGPEIQIPPRKSADERYLEWVPRIGTSATDFMLHQVDDDPGWVFDYTVPKSIVSKVKTAENGSGLTTNSYAAGQGQGEGRPIAHVSDPLLVNAGYPRLDSESTGHDTASQMDTLVGHAAGNLARNGRPVLAVTIEVDAESMWKRMPQIRPGDWCQLKVANHGSLPDGPHRLRIQSMAGGGDSVTLVCVPTAGSV